MIIVKQRHDEWLQYLNTAVSSLTAYLTRQNDGITVTEVEQYTDAQGNRIHVMSNGFSYVKNEQGKWSVVKQRGVR